MKPFMNSLLLARSATSLGFLPALLRLRRFRAGRPALRIAGAWLGALVTAGVAPAQGPDTVSADARAMRAALEFRMERAERIRAGQEQPEDSLRQLAAHPSPSGLRAERDAGVAIAAIDIGQRLVAHGSHAAAEPFFQEAERWLDRAVQRTPDKSAALKSMLLQKLALIRSEYLDKLAAARADLDRALALTPDDPFLKRRREQLPREPGEQPIARPQG